MTPSIITAIAREAGIDLSPEDLSEVLWDLRYDPQLWTALAADGYPVGDEGIAAALEAASRGGDAVTTVLVLRTKFGLPPF